ncbi:MAG: ATP-binding protein [Flavobacteriaceae bacterium]|nr:ATP-binding protein [Flavobacteriaceae bacterium]
MSFLEGVTKGKIEKPVFVVVYGPDGVGKSTFAASAPNPVFICSEEGTNELDIARFPEPSGYRDIQKILDELSEVETEFKTLVIDSLDWIEPMLIEYLCQSYGVSAINQGALAYGNGTIKMAEEWSMLLNQLRRIRDKRNMNIILIAHSEVKVFHDPLTEAGYDKYQLQLNQKSAAKVRQAVDAVLFCKQEVYTKENKQSKVKAYGDSKRILYTEMRPTHDAKNRYGLPSEIDLDWDEFYSQVRNSKVDINEQIEQLLGKVVDEKVREKAEKAYKANRQNPGKLAEIKARLEEIIT